VSTRPLRRFLSDQGWDANGWELGHNHGPRPGAEEKMQNRLATLFRHSGHEGPHAESIEVEGSHCGLGHNPSVLYAIADRLAQRAGHWKPFDPSRPQELDLSQSAALPRGDTGFGRLGNWRMIALGTKSTGNQRPP
jgi:hypothetical protein